MTLDPEHYRLRVEHIGNEVSRLPRNSPKQVVLLGTDLYEWNHATEVEHRPILNMGLAGDFIEHPAGGIMRRLGLLPMAQAGDIFLMAGINEILENQQPELILDKYDRLIQAVRRTVPYATLHLQSLLPTRDRYQRFMAHIALFNVMIEDAAGRHGLIYQDLFSEMEDDLGELSQTYTTDGLTLNDTGYDVFNGLLASGLKVPSL